MKRACPICEHNQFTGVWTAQRQPVLLNHLYASRREATNSPAADLDFVACNECGFVWNAAFDSDSIVYGPGYVNDQSKSPQFQRHLDDVLTGLALSAAEAPGDILEVGCGQGDFLRRLCRVARRNGIGFDPAAIEKDFAEDVSIHPRLLDEAAVNELIGSGRRIALIYCRHVLEHIADPKRMAASFARLMRNNPDATLYIEVPCFEWIARHGVFFDLFNEHCSLFNEASLHRLLVDAGFASVETAHAFGSQYLCAFASMRGSVKQSSSEAGEISRTLLRDRFAEHRDEVCDQVNSLLDRGPLLIWGAGAKGVSFVNQLGLDHHQVPCLIDINPAKQGRYVPITGHAVIAPSDVADWIVPQSNGSILVLNPNYVEEIAAMLRANEIDASLVSIDGSHRVEVHC